MKPYLISLGAGLLVGIVYNLLSSEPISASWLKRECAPHVLGSLPVGESAKPTEPDDRA